MLRKYFFTILSINLVFSIQLAAQFQKKHTISGYISEKGSKENLPGAIIYETKLKTGASTNNYGFYSLTLPEDSITVLISYVGFQPQMFKFFLTKDVQLNIALEQNAELKTVEIVAEKVEKVSQSTNMSTIDISIQLYL